MGQTEHSRMSPWGQQQGRASGLGAVIQTVTHNGQNLDFGISHPWSYVSVPSLKFGVRV